MKKRWHPPAPPANRFKLLPPSQRVIAAARKAGVRGGRAEIDAWARETNWTGVKVR